MVLMEALGGTNKEGESYSYYMFDIQHAEPPESNRKVQIAVKVITDSNRTNVRRNIVDALEDLIKAKGVGVTVVEHDRKFQLDYVVRNDNGHPQVIRVEIKPPSSSGSGGGAQNTILQESAMCVYAAIRYTWPNGDFDCDASRCHQVLNDNHFKVALKKCKLGKKVKLNDIKDLDKEWKDSLCLGANKIFETIGQGDYTFERGEKVDSAIGEAFKECNKKATGGKYFSNRNKWNPSDIWMYPTGTQTTLIGQKKQRGKGGSGIMGETTIDCLNKHMEDLFDDNKLIGISLKKITHDANATMKPLNQGGPAGFAQRKQADQTEFLGAKSKSMVVFDNGTKQVKQPDKKWPMDIYLYWGTGPQDRFQARNFGGPGTGAWQLELKGVSANQGKIKGEVVLDVLKNAGFTGMPTEIDFNKCGSQRLSAQPNDITNNIYKLLSHFKAKGLSKDKAIDINLIKQRSRSYRFSKINGLNLLKWLEDNNGSGAHTVASQAMKEIYLYASSQGDKASVYYKLT